MNPTWKDIKELIDYTCEGDRIFRIEVVDGHNREEYDIVNGFASIEEIEGEIKDVYTIQLLPSSIKHISI